MKAISTQFTRALASLRALPSVVGLSAITLKRFQPVLGCFRGTQMLSGGLGFPILSEDKRLKDDPQRRDCIRRASFSNQWPNDIRKFYSDDDRSFSVCGSAMRRGFVFRCCGLEEYRISTRALHG